MTSGRCIAWREDDQVKRLFIKEAKTLLGINKSEHIVKVKGVCIGNIKKLLFYPFSGGEEEGRNFSQICGFLSNCGFSHDVCKAIYSPEILLSWCIRAAENYYSHKFSLQMGS